MSLPIAGTGLANLLLGSLSCRCHGLSAGFLGCLATGFLRLENHQAGLPQTLLVFLGLGFRGGDISPRLQHGPFGALATLVKRLRRGLPTNVV